jgi:hypothetical protein
MNLQHLPKELINIILEFHGYHTFRNGKYMIQLSKDDPRYKILLLKPPIERNMYGFWEANLFQTVYERNYTYSIYTFEHSGYLHWCLDARYTDNHIFEDKMDYEEWKDYQCLYTKKSIHWVFEKHPKQNIPVHAFISSQDIRNLRISQTPLSCLQSSSKNN